MGNGIDIATLGIRVEATQVGQATQALRGLEAQGARVETVAGRTTVGMGRLNNALLGVARQATGTSPVLARMLDVMLGLAVGGAKMTLILGGLTALALGYRKLTEDSRNARVANEELIKSLRELSGVEKDLEQQRTLAAGGVALRNAQRELAILRGQGPSGGVSLRGGPTGQAAYDAAVARQAAAVSAALNRAMLMAGLLADARAATYEPQGPTLAQMGDPLADMLARANRGVGAFNEYQLPGLNERMSGAIGAMGVFTRGRSSVDMSGLSTQLPGQTKGGKMTELRAELAIRQEIANAARRAGASEDDLAASRIAANQALVGSLMNVGRAYGGVTDQVAALAAATLSMSRMPMANKGDPGYYTDRGRAYGTAALTGIGYGASTANPMLGGLAGGASGFMVAGPAGAILGAVGGIVSGLFAHAQRAKQAQLQWERAFQSFEDMWDELTPAQQTDRAFQSTFGMTVEQARGYVELFRGMEGVDNIIKALASYDRQMQQAAEQTDKMAKSEKDLYDARFRAMNAPRGFNASYYGWGAGASSGGGTSGGTTNVTINVTPTSADPTEIANEVATAFRRQAMRGGSSTVVTTSR